MMFRDPDHRPDVEEAIESLTAEAARLDTRVRLIREQLAAVNARMEDISDSLQWLTRPAGLVNAATGEDGCGEQARSGASNRPDGGCLRRSHRSVPRRH
ncbi:hypothetical protein ABZ707_31115 [Streptomyces sp. NPDC006923]|uniref:hypothetical protein n=1 Tax=Streptomyces sp. NPDC006923 TaxID=3155355 RepID=UPI0033FA31C3